MLNLDFTSFDKIWKFCNITFNKFLEECKAFDICFAILQFDSYKKLDVIHSVISGGSKFWVLLHTWTFGTFRTLLDTSYHHVMISSLLNVYFVTNT